MLICVDMLVPTTAKSPRGGNSGWVVAPFSLFTTTLSVTMSSVVRSVRSTLADSGLCAPAMPGSAASARMTSVRMVSWRIVCLFMLIIVPLP